MGPWALGLDGHTRATASGCSHACWLTGSANPPDAVRLNTLASDPLDRSRATREPCGRIAGTAGRSGRHEALVYILIAMHRQCELFEIVHALRPGSRLTDFLYGRHKQRDQDRDDGNHHEQFDQCEGVPISSFSRQQLLGGRYHRR